MSFRQQKFVAAYIGAANGNGTLAAKMAGYPEHRAATASWQQLKKPNVIAAVEAARPCLDPIPVNRELEISTREDRQAWLTHVMGNDDIDIRDRLKACELLCKVQGDFIEHRIIEDRREVAKLSDEELYSRIREKVFTREGIQKPWQNN